MFFGDNNPDKLASCRLIVLRILSVQRSCGPDQKQDILEWKLLSIYGADTTLSIKMPWLWVIQRCPLRNRESVGAYSKGRIDYDSRTVYWINYISFPRTHNICRSSRLPPLQITHTT